MVVIVAILVYGAFACIAVVMSVETTKTPEPATAVVSDAEKLSAMEAKLKKLEQANEALLQRLSEETKSRD
jgi:uncharacterized membrane protein YgcG